MFELSLNLSDPSKDSYYFPILIAIALILVIINLLLIYVKEIKNESNTEGNVSMDRTLDNNRTYPSILETNKKNLRIKYLVAYTITRSAMWAKAPYIYTLFMTLQKFSFAEIGDLYLIDAVAALIFGPITGQLADRYGRRKLCNFYNITIILNILLRMEGSKVLAYVAQIVTGMAAGLINTTFEAWLVYESDKAFGGFKKEAERYRKRLFKDINLYDVYISIITSFSCAFIYSYLGIFAPFWVSIILTAIAFFVIFFTWEENIPLIPRGMSTWDQVKEACLEFKKVDVTCIGLIEGIAFACLNIFLFSWTPILKQSTPGGMNVGFIFTCMVLCMIVGTKMYHMFIILLQWDYYKSIAGAMFLQGLLMYLIYLVDGFLPRMIFLALFNGVTGFYNPLNSIVKSVILIEKYRALLMNIFRIPLNFYVIIVLLTLRMMNPFIVAFINGTMCFVAFLIGLFLVIYLKTHPNREEEIDNNILFIDAQ